MGMAANVGAPLLGTAAQMYAGNKALGGAKDATNQANDLQRYMYDTTRADNMPALDARNSALASIKALLADPSSITKDPSYGFQLGEGQKRLENGAAARGMTYSGQQGKALQRYGQDFAGTKLDESFNRLSRLAGLGESGAGRIAGAGSSYASNTGNNLMGLADARSEVAFGNARQFGNALNGMTAYGNKNGWWNTPGN